MQENPVQFENKRELGKIISDSFLFVKQEYKPLARLMVRYLLPFLALYSYLQVNLQSRLASGMDLSDPDSIMQNIGPFYSNVFVFSLFGVFVQSMLLTLLYTYIEQYVKKGPGNIQMTDVSNALFHNGLLVLGTALSWYFITLLGLLTFFVPGIFFANSLSLAVFIVLFERKGISSALSRSWQLVSRKWWNTLSLCVTGVLFTWLSSIVLSIPKALLFTDPIVSGTTPDTPTIAFWLVNGITSILSNLLWIFPYILLAFQYFNLKLMESPDLPPSE